MAMIEITTSERSGGEASWPISETPARVLIIAVTPGRAYLVHQWSSEHGITNVTHEQRGKFGPTGTYGGSTPAGSRSGHHGENW